MMKDVLINIKGTQGIENDTDTIELTTVGRFGHSESGYMMSYDEGELLGVKGVKTVLRVKNDGTVVLRRYGKLKSRLTVQKGIRNTCFYSTPQGDIIIGIFGESVNNELSEGGGSFSMSYTIDSNLKLISRNVVEISVKEVENNVNTCC